MGFWRALREKGVLWLVELWRDLRERRLFRIAAGYLAAGWLVLQGADQLAGRDIISELAYRLVLVGYLAGIPASFIVGWFHGEKGDQKLSLLEVGLLSVVGIAAVGAGAMVVESHRTSATSLAEASGLDLRRVAVLYREATDDPELASIADGLTGAVVSALRRVDQLDVVSVNGVRPYREADVTADSIARALEVGTVVTGSVIGSEQRLQITTQLHDGNSGAVVTRDAITVSRDQLLSARDSVGEVLSRQLRRWIGAEFAYRTQRSETSDVHAWVLLQRGERLLRQARVATSQHRTDSALSLFRRADSTLAVAERADTAWIEPTVARSEVAYRKARTLATVVGDRQGTIEAIETGIAHADRALEREPGDADALATRGTLRYLRWFLGLVPDAEAGQEWLQQARRDLEAAVEADPTLASAYNTLSHLYYQPAVSDLVGAALAARRAYEADAYLQTADDVLWRLFRATLDLGQFGQARRWCEEGRARFPADHRFRMCGLQLLASPELDPHVEDAWELARAVDSLAPPARRQLPATEAEMYVGGVLARAGLTDSAESVLSRARSRVDHEVDPEGYLLGVEAYMRVLLDQQDRAIDLLGRYVSAHPEHEFGVAGEISWRWRSLQDHPRFQRIRE